MTDIPFIAVHDLTHVYNASTAFEKKAIDSICLTIQKGECIGLIGHTGSGKSTFIQHLNALLKPTAGQILLDGEDINADKKQLKRIRQRIGLVFQYPEHQLFDLTVFKDVSFGPANMGLPPEEVQTRAREALAQVGLAEELYEKSPFELSGGQKRRAAIAGVLAMRPDLLIMDEPTAGLDPGGREDILSYIQSMRKDGTQTIILVSHSMEDVARLASRIIVMAKGRVVCDGTPAAVFEQQELLESIGLAVPQAAVLSRRLREAGIPMPADVFTVEEAAQVLFSLAQAKGMVKL